MFHQSPLLCHRGAIHIAPITIRIRVFAAKKQVAVVAEDLKVQVNPLALGVWA